MSDSMAFLAGGAFAGVAALLLLKGGVNLGQSNVQPAPQQPPLPVQTYAPTPPGMVPGSPYLSSYNLEQQRLMDERLKYQLEQQQTETEQLKTQLRNQQLAIDTLTAQAKANTLPAPAPLKSAQVLPTSIEQQPANPIFTGILWALGGMVVTVSGGVVAVVALALVSQKQRPARTVQVIHPINTYQPVLPPQRRRSEFLPPRLETRRIEEIDYDDR